MFCANPREHPEEEGKYAPLVELLRLQGKVEQLEISMEKIKGLPDLKKVPSTIEAAKPEKAGGPGAARTEPAAPAAPGAPAMPAAPAAVAIQEGCDLPLSPTALTALSELLQSQKIRMETLASDHENQLKSLRTQLEALRSDAVEQSANAASQPPKVPDTSNDTSNVHFLGDGMGNGMSNGMPTSNPPGQASLQTAAAPSLEDMMDTLRPEFIRRVDKAVGEQLDKKVEEMRNSLHETLNQKHQLDKGSLWGSERDSKVHDQDTQLDLEHYMNAAKESPAHLSVELHSPSQVERTFTHMKSVTHVLDNMAEPEYEVEQNTWTSALFIGLPCIGKTATVIATLCILINCFVQLLFCVVIQNSFTVNNMATKEGIEMWRSASHDDKHLDPITGSSLVARVCFEDPALSVATGHTTFLQNMQSYREPTLGFETGPMLFVLSWLLWFLFALAEGLKTLKFTHALTCLPRGPTKLSSSEGKYSLDSIHSSRLFMMLLLCMFRLFICCALGYSGSLWLAYELDATNLILNAAALGFIMDLDELIYEVAMCPCVKIIVSCLGSMPLHTEHHLSTSGYRLRRYLSYKIGYNCIATVVVGGASLYYLLTQYIQLNLDQMGVLHDALCGGQTDFVYRSRSDNSLMLARKTPRFTPGSKSPHQKRLQDAVKQLWMRETDVQQDDWAAWLAPNKAVFEAYASVPVETLTYNPGVGSTQCDSSQKDTDIGMAVVVRAMRLHTGGNGTGCLDFVPYCSQKSQSFLRLQCPSQCGCQAPQSGLYFKGPNMGCPTEKCIASVTYKRAFSGIKCIDSEWNSTGSRAGFQRFWDDFGEAQSAAQGGMFMHSLNSTVVRLDETGIYDPIRWLLPAENSTTPTVDLDSSSFSLWAQQKGCDVIALDAKIRFTFCFETSEVSSMTPFCPVACGCRETPELAGCPPTCKAFDNRYQAALDSLNCTNFPQGEFITSAWLGWAGQTYERFSGSYKMNLRHNWTMILEGNLDAQTAANTNSQRTWWQFMDGFGCPSFGRDGWETTANFQSLCNSFFGIYDLSGLCPELCYCRYTGGPSCPASCQTATADIFGSGSGSKNGGTSANATGSGAGGQGSATADTGNGTGGNGTGNGNGTGGTSGNGSGAAAGGGSGSGAATGG